MKMYTYESLRFPLLIPQLHPWSQTCCSSKHGAYWSDPLLLDINYLWHLYSS